MGVDAGSRVGVVLSADEDEVRYVGLGTYEGEFPPYGAGGMCAGLTDEEIDGLGLTNPRIRLDDGNVVWGCECWWGPEGAYRRMLEDARECGATLVKVDVPRDGG